MLSQACRPRAGWMQTTPSAECKYPASGALRMLFLVSGKGKARIIN